MPTVEFLPLAVNPADYPAPRLSMLPALPRVSWLGAGRPKIPSAFFDAADFFVYGRYALVEALKRCGAGPGKAVLLPAYHCRTIVESVLHLGAEARFYPMTPDLHPDWRSMRALAADGHVCAMVMTHYFGFANDLEPAVAFCAAHDITLIEDCAHAFYGQRKGRVLGSAGRFAIASAWKFLPVRDGAMLLDNACSRCRAVLRTQPLPKELKALAAWGRARLSRGRRNQMLPDADGAFLVARAVQLHRGRQLGQVEESVGFHPDEVSLAGLRTSRWLIDHAPHDEVAAARRSNYRRWLTGVSTLPGVEPLFPALLEGFVPYAFPLLADAEGLIFHALKLAGVPIWRWEDTAVTTCPVARAYRLRLLQLPCHQDLRTSEIDWMVNTLKTVLAALRRSGATKTRMSFR